MLDVPYPRRRQLLAAREYYAALEAYSRAIALCPAEAEGRRAVFHCNRAACLLSLDRVSGREREIERWSM